MKRHLQDQWFLIALAGVLLGGFLFPEFWRDFASSSRLRSSIVASVLFVMALPLETRAVVRTLLRPTAALLGSLVNMGLLPLIAWGVASLARGELATGLIIAATAPCTLASAAVWTRRAGGNDAVAIMVTLLTNATCFLVTPCWLLWLTSQSTEISLSEMVAQLGLLVVLPMSLAQFVRQYQPIGTWATRRKRQLSTLAQGGILAMVLIGAVNASFRLNESNWREHTSLWDVVQMFVSVCVVHLLALAAGWLLAGAIRLPRAEQIAVAMSGSQKTLMVGLYVAINYFGGLTLLPMVAYHVAQLVIDTLIADRWRRSVQATSDNAD